MSFIPSMLLIVHVLKQEAEITRQLWGLVWYENDTTITLKSQNHIVLSLHFNTAFHIKHFKSKSPPPLAPFSISFSDLHHNFSIIKHSTVQPTFKAAERNKKIVRMRDIKFPARSGWQHRRYWNNQNGKRENVTQDFAKSFFLFCFLFISFIYCRVWCSARVVRDNVNLGQQQETMQFHTTQQIGTIAQIQSEADAAHLSPGWKVCKWPCVTVQFCIRLDCSDMLIALDAAVQ